MQALAGILPYIQIVTSILLMVAILMQQSDAGLGAIFGGGDDIGGAPRTRRGFEKTLFQGSIGLSIIFVASVVVSLLI